MIVERVKIEYTIGNLFSKKGLGFGPETGEKT